MTPHATYSIVDDGAVPDGITLNTEAIQKTLDRVTASGGGQDRKSVV